MTNALTTAPGYDSTRVSANCLTYVRTLPSDCTVNTIYIGARLSARHAALTCGLVCAQPRARMLTCLVFGARAAVQANTCHSDQYIAGAANSTAATAPTGCACDDRSCVSCL